MNRICVLLALTLASAGAMAQTLSSVESVEYEPNSNRWFVNAGSSILVTADEGISWETVGNGGATHGMEVLGSSLFAIRNNVIFAFDVVTGEELGSVAPTGASFLNGMGSESSELGDFLVVSDFGTGRLLKIDVSDPGNMVASTLLANTGTTPNGVTVKDGLATVVNWGGNADILQVDVATGELTTLIDGTGLGNCDGVDWANGSLVVSSWSPQRITRFTPDPDNSGTWLSETLIQGSPLSNPADLSVNTLGDLYGVACSGNNTVYFGPLLDVSAITPIALPGADAQLTSQGITLEADVSGTWFIQGMDALGRALGTCSVPCTAGAQLVDWSQMGAWGQRSALLTAKFTPTASGVGAWQTTLKRVVLR